MAGCSLRRHVSAANAAPAAQHHRDTCRDEDRRTGAECDTCEHREREPLQHLSAEEIQRQHGHEHRGSIDSVPPGLADAGLIPAERHVARLQMVSMNRGARAIVRVASAFVVAALAAPADGQDLPTGVLEHNAPVYVTRSRDRVPLWMEVPREARLQTGDGLTFTPLRNSAISYENLKLGVLVGVLRNDGPCVQNLSARLHYVDAEWQPIGSAIPNDARVSRVEAGGLLPFRFRLRDLAERGDPPSGFVIVVEEDERPLDRPFAWHDWAAGEPRDIGTAAACTSPAAQIETSTPRRLRRRDGYVLIGTATVVGSRQVRADAIVFTAVLRNATGDVLEVLVGTPLDRGANTADVVSGPLPAQRLEYRLQTDIPLGGDVADVLVMAEALPDAVVGDVPPD